MSSFAPRGARAWGYASGQFADGIKQAAFNYFVFFFYNQVLGLPAPLAGAVAFLSLTLDALTDPLVGRWSDRTTSRWGRRHPFMLAGALPFPVGLYFLFSPPPGLSDWGLFGWMLCAAAFVRVLHTLFYVPHLSLGAELVRGYHERTVLISRRMLCAYAGTVVTSTAGFVFFFPEQLSGATGLLEPGNFAAFGGYFGGLAFAAMMICIVSTLGAGSALPRTPSSGTPASTSYAGLISALRGVLAIRSCRAIMLALLIFMSINGMTLTLGVYIAVHNYGFRAWEIGLATAAPLVALLIGPRFAQNFSASLGKKKALNRAIVLGAVIATLPLVLYSLGFYQQLSELQGLVLVLSCMGVGYGFFMAYQILFDSMLSDLVDLRELETGHREEGTFFALRAFAQKASFGIGSLLAGAVLALIAFPEQATPGSVAPETLQALALLGGPMTLLGYLGSLFFTTRYELDEKQHARIRQELDGMRA